MSSDASALSSVVCKWMYVDTRDTREIRDMRHERDKRDERREMRDERHERCSCIYPFFCCLQVDVCNVLRYIHISPTHTIRAVCLYAHTHRRNTLKHRHTHTQTQTNTHSNTQSQRMSHTRDSTRLFELLRLHATHCNTLQHSVTLCNSLQLSATVCTTLQHTATLGPHATYVYPLPLASLRRIDKFDFFFNLRVFIKE